MDRCPPSLASCVFSAPLRVTLMIGAHPGIHSLRRAELPPLETRAHLMSMPLVIPRYMAEEIRHFPDDRLRYEVIRGALFVNPAPGLWHQRTVSELHRFLQEYLERYSLGEAIIAPYEVLFTADTAVQPDVVVVLNERLPGLTPERFRGAPSLVVEVVSYSSKRTDRLEKRELYRQEGVPEYWVVDPERRTVERWTREVAEPVVLTDRLQWQAAPAFAPLEIDLEALFVRVRR